MRGVSSDSSWRNVLEAFVVPLFFILILYPGFLFFTSTPMLGLGWELQDPVVSFANFEPSFRVFQYELIHHKNLLWSNLRAMGLPLLANDVHAAPMFPLTLLLFWVPAEYFWNIFVVARLLLMGAGTYLLARGFLKFSRIPAIFFVLCFIFSMFVLRWMNHSWQNGLLAGIWYLYFLFQVLQHSRSAFRLKRCMTLLGLTLCVYAMVTCGFPEASAMFAVLVVLVYSPFVLSMYFAGKVQVTRFLMDLVIAHAVGFALSAAQIFSIFEMLALYEGAERRAVFGLRQFALQDFFPFWAENLALITGAEPTLFRDSRTYLGLIPLFFFLVGVLWSVRNVFRITYMQVGALLCGLFILLKLFPFWGAFNHVVGSLPVLRESYFFVYFLSIFLWFFAFFAAQGVQVLFYGNCSQSRLVKLGWHLLSLASALTVLVLVWLSAPVVYQVDFIELLATAPGYVHVVVLLAFGAAVIIAQLFLCPGKYTSRTAIAGAMIVVLALVELAVVLPRNFGPITLGLTRQSNKLARDITARGIPLAEVRIIDSNGTYVSGGIATIDNGAPAVLPHRLVTFRQSLFEAPWGGYLSLRKAKYPYSWPLTSTSLFYSIEPLGPVIMNYDQMEKIEAGEIRVDEVKIAGEDPVQNRAVISDGQDIVMRGWAVDIRDNVLSVPYVFVVFRSVGNELSFPARKVFRPDVAGHFADNNAAYAGWEMQMGAEFLPPGVYGVAVRGVGGDGTTYFDEILEEKVEVRDTARSFAEAKDRSVQFEYITSTKQGFVYHNKNALPRAYMAGRCSAVVDLAGSVQGLTDPGNFKLGDVFVEGLSAAEKKVCQSINDREPGRIPVKEDLGREVLLGPVQGPGVLVLNDNYYPGWEAVDRLSGEQLRIRPANIAMRALILPEAKDYEIIFRYIPEWLGVVRILFWSACLAVGGLFGLALTRSIMNRESG